MPSPSGQSHRACFSLAGLEEERPSLRVLAAAALRACGLRAPCPRPRASGQPQPARGNSGHRIWAAQAARKASGQSRRGGCDHQPPGEALQRGDGGEAGRAPGEIPAVPSGQRGARWGEQPRHRARGGIPREEWGLPAERQQGCTRGKPPGSKPVWGHARQRRGQGRGTGGSVVTSPGNALAASPLAQLLARHLLAGTVIFPRQPPTANLALTI